MSGVLICVRCADLSISLSASRVMAAGSSRPWDRLLSETTELAPSAEPLLAFFRPLRRLTGEPTRPLRTLELEGQWLPHYGLSLTSPAALLTLSAGSSISSTCLRVGSWP